MEFLVIDQHSTYYRILERSALKELWAVTSTHHLCTKFPTKRGIATVRGDQRSARECYSSFLQKVELRSVNVILMKINEVDNPAQGDDVEMVNASEKEATMEYSQARRSDSS